MLDILRKQASSWIIKVALGVIAIVFIFFFGSSTLRNPQSGQEVAAKIDDFTITERMVAGRTRLAQENNPLYKALPENLSEQLRQSTLGSIIEGALIKKEAPKAGVVITADEVGKLIRQNPALTGEDGKFDYRFYQERFRPGYLNRYGVDYEEWVEERLLEEEFKGLFEKVVVVADEEVRQHYAEKNKEPDWKEFEKVKDQEKEELRSEIFAQYYSQWYREAATRAKIKIQEK